MSKEEKTDSTIPGRNKVREEDTWDLSKLYADDSAWEKGFEEFQSLIPEIGTYKGTLGESPEKLREFLDFMNRIGILEERLGYYAHLRMSEDGGNNDHQAKMARFMQISSQAEALSSFYRTELLEIPEKTMNSFLKNPVLDEFTILLEKILRFRPHILPEREEKILALQIESNQTASKAFHALTDVDLDFGTVETPDGNKPLSQASFSSFLMNQNRELREKAYNQFYGVYEAHKNTLAALYGGSVHLDVYQAKVRNYPSAREAALFPDKVPAELYDNLISTVREHFSTFHRYYALRKKVLQVDQLRHYDVYVPLVKSVQVNYPYEEAVDIVIRGLSPMGEEYCSVLKEGLLGRWVDRYENKGKRSGAFSAGSYVGDPYILMNYKPDVLRDLFTLAHEAGHSMHSWYSAANNPFQHYSYTIFEAEVASTVNEKIVGDYMLKQAESPAMEAYLIGKDIDDIIATIVRQTMFAEYEHLTHAMVEKGEPLTVESLRNVYRQLLEEYFGPDMVFEEVSDLEGLRIPHFYRAFYVYKYATGLSAAIALSRGILEGGEENRDRYISFLKSGGSAYPLESLKRAGVDMTTPEPISYSLKHLDNLIKKMEDLLHHAE